MPKLKLKTAAPKPPAQRQVHTVAQLRDLGVFTSTNKFYNAVARGEIVTFLDGKRRMTSQRAVDDYIAWRERETLAGNLASSVPTPMSDANRERLAALNASRKHGRRRAQKEAR